MKAHSNRSTTGAPSRPTDFPFEIWANDSADFYADEAGSFDDNWIVSAGDLFGKMDLPTGLLEQDEFVTYYDKAA